MISFSDSLSCANKLNKVKTKKNKTKKMIKSLVVLSVVLTNLIVLSSAACTIRVPQDEQLRPKLRIEFERKYFFEIKNQLQLTLTDNDSATAVCDSGFELSGERNYYQRIPQATSNYTTLTLQCQQDYLMVNGIREWYREVFIHCAKYLWSLYEPTTSSTWCHNNQSKPFVLATSSVAMLKTILFANICYDMDAMSIRTISYSKGFANDAININNISINPLRSTDVNEIPDFGRFSNTIYHENLLQQRQADDESYFWQNYNFDNFVSASLIQDKQYARIFDTYEQMLNINWWPSLLHGNWKHFMHALETHTTTTGNVYHILTGSSGTAPIPFKESKCQHEATTNRSKYGMRSLNKNIPEYIWTYLEESRGFENFVVVAYNSPFFEFFDKEKLIFCKDICDTIEWLKDAHSTFRYAAFGVVFCCSLEEVLETDILKEIQMEKLMSSTTAATIETESTISINNPNYENSNENFAEIDN